MLAKRIQQNKKLRITENLPKRQNISTRLHCGRLCEKVNYNQISKNAVFWDVMQCGSCNSRRFGGP
jgi:hypothetical protein